MHQIIHLTTGTVVTVIVPYQLQVQATLGTAISYCQTSTFTTTGTFIPETLTNCIYSATSTSYQIQYSVPTGYSNVLTYTFTLGPILNPSSVRIPDTFQVSMAGTPTGSINSGLALTSYVPGPITLVSFTDNNPTCGVVDQYTFTFKITNPIDQYGFLALTFPTSSYSSAPANIISITTITAYGTPVSSPTLAASGAITYKVIYNHIFDSYGIDTPDSTQTIVIYLSAVTNPTSIGTTSSFTIQTMDADQNIIDQINTGVTLSIINPGVVTINSFSFSSYVVDATFYITLDVTTSVKYTSGGYISVVGMTNYITSSGPVCSAIIGFASGLSQSCTNSPTTTITFTKNLGTSTTQTFIVYGFIQPLAVMTVTSFSVYYKNSDNSIVAQATTGLGYTTTGGTCTMSSAVRSTTVLTVGLTGAKYTFTFSCVHRLTYKGSMVFIIPPGQIVYNALTTCQNSLSATLTCTVSSVASGTQVSVPVLNWCGSGTLDCSAGTSLTFSLINAQNPGYIESPITTSIQLNSYNIIQTITYLVDTMAVVPIVSFTNSLTPGIITTLVVVATGSTLTGGVPVYTFTFTTKTAITAGGYIKITFPGLTVYDPSTSLTCTSSIGTSTCSYTATTNNPSDINTLSYTAACPGGCAASQAFTLSATTFTNPFSTLANANNLYMVQTYTSVGYLIDQGTYTYNMITLTPNSLTASITAPTTPIVVGQTTTYTISINNPNNVLPLYTGGSGGTLVITPPSEIAIQSSTCTAQSSAITLTCAVSSALSYVTVTSSTTLPKNSNIIVSLPNNVRNPQTGAPSSTFTIKSYYQGTAQIDTLGTALTLTADTANSLLNVESTRSDTLVSSPTATIITLTITFTTTNPVPVGSYISFSVPIDQAVNNGGTLLPIDTDDGNAISTISGPTIGATYTTFTLKEWCSPNNAGGTCPSGTTFTVQVSGFQNPTTAVASSTSMIISLTTGGTTPYIIDAISAGVFTLPYVNYGPLTINSFTRVGDTVGLSATYTISFTTMTGTNGDLSGGTAYVYIHFPVGFIYDIGSTSLCKIMIPTATSYSTTTCSPTGATDTVQNMGSYVQVLTSDMSCTAACTGGTTYSYQFSGYVNPFSTKSVNGGKITVATQFVSGGLFQVKNSIDLTIGTSVTFNSYTPNTITVNSITRSPTTVGLAATITLDLNLPTRLQKNGYIIVDVPTSQYTANGATVKYSPYYSGGYQTAISATLLSSTQLQMKEWCNNGGSYCSTNTNLKFQITSGFNNLRYVAAATNYFTMTTKTSDQLGTSDQMISSQSIATSNALTQAAGTITSVALSSALVGASSTMTVKLTFGSSIITGDTVTLSLSAEFIRSDAGTLTCADGSAVSKTCYSSSTSYVVNSVSVSSYCSSTCSSSTSYTVAVSNCVNLLEVKAYSGTMTMQTSSSGGYPISSATYSLSSVATIAVNKLTAVITRASAYQGVTTTFQIDITPQGWVQTGSKVTLQMPKDSILYQTGQTSFLSSPGTLTSQTSTTTYQTASVSIWSCTSANCPTSTTFTTTISNAMNPYITTTSFNNYIINMYAADGNPSFVSTTPLIATPALAISPLINVVVTQSSTIINQTPQYVFTFTTTTITPAGATFQIIFPNNRAYASSASTLSCVSGSTAVSATATTSSSTQPFVLTLSNCASACPIGTYTFTCSGGMVNPSVVETLSGQFTISSISTLGYYINQGTFSNSMMPSILPYPITATVTRSNTQLGAQNVYTVKFTTNTAIPSGGYLRFVVPPDQIEMPSSPICQDTTIFTNYNCAETFEDFAGNIWLDMLTACSGGCAAKTTFSIAISRVSNPSLLTANNVTSTWLIYTMDASKNKIDCACSNIQATPALVGISVIIQDAQIDDPIVNTYTYFRIKFQPGADFTNLGIFDIFFPDLLFKYRNLDICYWATLVNLTVKCQFTNYNSGFIYSVRLTTPCQPTCSATSSYVFMIPVQTRPDVYPVGGLFQVITRYAKLDVGQGYYGNALTIQPAKIMNFTVTNLGCDQVQQICNLYLSFRPINDVPTSGQKGRILVTLPTQITNLQSCDFFVQGNNYNTKCDIYPESNTMYLYYTIPTSIAKQNLTVIMYRIRNPSSTAPTDVFTIQSQWDVFNTNIYYNIDQNLTGVYYKVNDPYPFQSISVIRSGMTNKTGYLTGEKTQLTFNIQLYHALDFSAQFQFQTPNSTVSYYSNGTLVHFNASQVKINPNPNSFTCYAVDMYGNQLNQLYCRYNSTNQSVSILNYCYVANCGQGDMVRFKLYDDFILNFNYVVYPLDKKNNSLKVYSTTANGYYFIDGMTTGVFVTPDLIPDNLIMPVPQIVRTGNTVYQDIQWIVSFQVNVNPIPQRGYIIITIPEGVLYPIKNYSIELSDFTTSYVFKKFDLNKSSDGSITKITIYNFCNRTNATQNLTNCSIGTAYSIYINKIQNPPAVNNVNQSIVVATFTGEGYAIEKGVPPPVNKLFPQLLPFTITKIDIKPMNPIPNAITDYQIVFNNNGKISYGNTSSILLEFPKELTLLNQSSSSLQQKRVLQKYNTLKNQSQNKASNSTNQSQNNQTNGGVIQNDKQTKPNVTQRCTSLFEPYLNVTCEQVGPNKIRIYGLFVSNIQHYGVQIKYIQNPKKNLTTSPLVAYIINDKNQTVASRSTQTRIPIFPVTQETGCSKVCGTCSGNNATCTSCRNPSLFPILKDYTCVQDCGPGYFFELFSLQCYKCHISCDTCYGPGNNKCLKCSSQYFMENGVCKTQCTNGNLQNSTSNQCMSPKSQCSRNCSTCSADTNYCLSCKVSFPSQLTVYDPTNGKCIKNDEKLCNSSNSDGYYINKTSSTCQLCNTLCKTCSQQNTQCYSCQIFQTKSIINDLYQTCVDSCGLGTYYNATSNMCSWCNPVCMICDSHMPDRCLACNSTPEGKQLYLYISQCVVDCPQNYEKNGISYTCDKINIQYYSFAFYFVGASVAIIVILLILSSIFSLCTNKIFDLLYALLSMVESFNRACIMGNLWVNSSVFTLAISFMCLIGTAAIGVFFNFLFMSPIYAHSPHFRTLNKKHGCAYSTISFFSFISGVNLMRMLSSRFFGCRSLSSDLNQWKFYLEPLNTMANFTLIFSLAQGGICAYILFIYQVYNQIYVFAAFGAFNNAIFVLLQLFKHLGTRAFIAKQEKEEKEKQLQSNAE